MTALRRLTYATLFAVLPAAALGDWQPRSVVGAYLAGSHAQVHRDLGAAADFLAAVVEADPENTGLLRRTFTLSLAAGAERRMVGFAGDLLDIDPEDPLARLALVVDAARQGEWDVADDRIAGMRGEGIERAIIPLVRAWLSAGQGEMEGALASLDELGAIGGFEGLADIHRALILDVGGDLPGALDAFDALGDLGNTVRLVQAYASIVQRGDDPAPAEALTADLAARGSDNVMIAEIAQRLEAGETVAPPVRDAAEGLAEAMFYIASIANQERGPGASDVALIYARFALMLRPDFPAASVLVGDILTEAGQPGPALDAYAAAARGDGATGALGWVARLRSTIALERLDRHEEALDLVTDLIAERPDHPDPFLRMGDLYRVQSMFGPAVIAYDDAARRDPGLVEEDWTFLYRRAIVLERADRFDRAEEDFRRAIDIRPDEAHLLNYLGYSLLDRDMKLDEAEDLIRRAIELLPDDGAIIDSLGWVYYKRGDLDRAVRTLEAAVARIPEDPVLNDHLGDAYWRVGREREARFQWERALRAVDADDEEFADSIREKLVDGLTVPVDD